MSDPNIFNFIDKITDKIRLVKNISNLLSINLDKQTKLDIREVMDK